MNTLSGNPTSEVTVDGEYVIDKNFGAGNRPVRLEIYGDRGGGTVQPGLEAPDGTFEPLLAAVESEDESTAWEVTPGYTGKIAFKLDGSTGASLYAVTSQRRF